MHTLSALLILSLNLNITANALTSKTELSLNPPEVDKCFEEAVTNEEIINCSNLDLKIAEGKMNEIIASIIVKIKTYDSRDLMQTRLEKSQSDWLQFRASHCQLEGILMLEDPTETVIVRNCYAQLTKDRVKQLSQFNSDF